MHGAQSTDAKAITQSARVGWPSSLRPCAEALEINEKCAKRQNIQYVLFLIKWLTVPQTTECACTHTHTHTMPSTAAAIQGYGPTKQCKTSMLVRQLCIFKLMVI